MKFIALLLLIVVGAIIGVAINSGTSDDGVVRQSNEELPRIGDVGVEICITPERSGGFPCDTEFREMNCKDIFGRIDNNNCTEPK